MDDSRTIPSFPPTPVVPSQQVSRFLQGKKTLSGSDFCSSAHYFPEKKKKKAFLQKSREEFLPLHWQGLHPPANATQLLPSLPPWVLGTSDPRQRDKTYFMGPAVAASPRHTHQHLKCLQDTQRAEIHSLIGAENIQQQLTTGQFSPVIG